MGRTAIIGLAPAFRKDRHRGELDCLLLAYADHHRSDLRHVELLVAVSAPRTAVVLRAASEALVIDTHPESFRRLCGSEDWGRPGGGQPVSNISVSFP